MSHTRIHPRHIVSGIPNWRALLPVWIICAFLFALFAAVFIKQYLDARPQRSDVSATSLDSGLDLSLSTASLSSGSIHLFTIKSSGQELRFLVQKTSDNVVHVAAATCRSCNRAYQQHYAHRGTFYCGRCREAMHFETRDPNSHSGCSMPEIPHSETGGVVLVRASDVKAAYESEFR